MRRTQRENIMKRQQQKYWNCSRIEKLAALSALEFREFYSMRLSNSSPVDFLFSSRQISAFFFIFFFFLSLSTMTLRYSNCWLPCWHPHSWYGPDDKVKYAQKEQKITFLLLLEKLMAHVRHILNRPKQKGEKKWNKKNRTEMMKAKNERREK